MALSPTPDSALKNEGKILSPVALGPKGGKTPPTAVPMMNQDFLVLVPPSYSLVDATGARVNFEDFWDDYARLAYGALGTTIASNVDHVLSCMEHRNIGMLVLACSGQNVMKFPSDDIDIDGLRIMIKFAKKDGRPLGTVDHLVLPLMDVSQVFIRMLWDLGLEMGLKSLTIANHEHYIGYIEVSLKGLPADIEARLGLYKDYIRPDSMAIAMRKRAEGFTFARVLYEAYGTAKRSSMPPPAPDTAAFIKDTFALVDVIRSAPAASLQYPERSAIGGTLRIVSMLFP